MQPSDNRLRLGELMRKAGLVSEEQVSDALREQFSSGERLGRCLLRLGHVSETSLLETLGSQLGLPGIDLSRTSVSSEARDSLPLDFVRAHRVLPVELNNGTIRVATFDPGNRKLIDDIRLLTGLEVEESLATERELTEKISECYGITVERMIEDFRPSEETEARVETLHDIEVMASEPTVVNLVNVILSTALKERASDVHIVPFENKLELRYRIDGVLQEMPPPPKHLHAALISRIKIMAEINIAERLIPQDGHFQIQHAGRRVDVRVGTMPTIYGESVVLRLLEKDSRVLTLPELGLDEPRVAKLNRLVKKPHGIFLATGPTGCGKTTTLYSVLNSIYTTEKKILTIEDPVEYELPGVGQISVRPARGFTFASGLRSILRQDPDIIMVGEIRDVETAEIAIRAALTGHLVFSTLHTNDAAGAVTRLLDMGIEAFLISSSLEAVLAQRLVRRICPACKQETEVEAALRHEFETLGVRIEKERYYRGAGCERCRNTGYRGRTGLFELFVLSPAMREMVLAKRPSTEIKSTALRNMTTIREDGLNKAAAGITTLEEILRVAVGDPFEV